jgi:hypothetical protein
MNLLADAQVRLRLPNWCPCCGNTTNIKSTNLRGGEIKMAKADQGKAIKLFSTSVTKATKTLVTDLNKALGIKKAKPRVRYRGQYARW